MSGIFTILVIIGCVALILFVLVQNPKGGGLNSEFGSAVQLGGAKRATDILEKGTWGLAIGVAVLCLGMAAGGRSAGDDDEGTEIQTNTEDVIEEPSAGDNPTGIDPNQSSFPNGGGGNGGPNPNNR